jgi:hypothetical protein
MVALKHGKVFIDAELLTAPSVLSTDKSLAHFQLPSQNGFDHHGRAVCPQCGYFAG